MSFVRPAGNIPVPSVNYTLICAGIMILNHNEYKILKVIGYGTILKKNDRLSLVGISSGKYYGRNIYEADIISASLSSAHFYYCCRLPTIRLIGTVWEKLKMRTSQRSVRVSVLLM